MITRLVSSVSPPNVTSPHMAIVREEITIRTTPHGVEAVEKVNIARPRHDRIDTSAWRNVPTACSTSNACDRIGRYRQP